MKNWRLKAKNIASGATYYVLSINTSSIISIIESYVINVRMSIQILQYVGVSNRQIHFNGNHRSIEEKKGSGWFIAAKELFYSLTNS